MKNFTLIVDSQASLMQKFRDIEHANGFGYIPMTLPIDPGGYHGQAEIRRLAGCIFEEIAEAQLDYFKVLGTSDKVQEELIDAMHFIAELVLTVGWKPEELPGELELETLDDYEISFSEVYMALGGMLNLLKNKPWKQKLKPFDAIGFTQSFENFLLIFFRLCACMGINDELLLQRYEEKAAVNRDRIATGV